MKRPNIWIIATGGSKNWVKGTENIFNEIKKKFSSKETETYPDIRRRTKNIQYLKNNSPWHIIIKTLDIQNEEKILKVSRGKYQIKK